MNDFFGGQRRGSNGWSDGAERDQAFERVILAIPVGKASTYGKVAAAAGYPRHHRAVASLLRGEHFDRLPWHRVIGADGAIKTAGDSAKKQRARLRQEGVLFLGGKVDLGTFLHDPGPAGE